MRMRHPLVLAVAAVGLVLVAAPAAQACWFFGKKHQRPMYVAPQATPCPPGMTYPAGPPVYPGMAPGFVVPPGYRMAPGQGTYVQPMPVPATGARPMPAATATASAVSAKDNSFDPPTLNVRPGTTVRWTNTGRNPHTVTDRDGKFDSGDIAPGASYTYTFQTPGTYRYYCKHHKGMEGTIVVGEPGKGPGAGGGSGPKGPAY